jgi:hypothetical protein
MTRGAVSGCPYLAVEKRRVELIALAGFLRANKVGRCRLTL